MNVVGSDNSSLFSAIFQVFLSFVFKGCDNAIRNTTQHVSDDDCRMVCSATHTQYCGNANRLAIYQFSPSDQTPSPQICLATDVGNFTLMAKFKNPLTQGPTAVPLKVVMVEMVENVLWTILSVSFVVNSFLLLLTIDKYLTSLRHVHYVALNGRI